MCQNFKVIYVKVINVSAFFLFLLLADSFSQSSIVSRQSMQSRILNQTIGYSVIFPIGYDKNQQSYPVIYLLHGIGGDGNSWIKRCNIDRLVDSLKECSLISDFIFIMPDAKNSYYINNYNKTFSYENFFINELIPYIESTYRIKASKENRAIMGLSMGGFGAVLLGIKHPDVFGTVVSMSGALRDSLAFVNIPQTKYNVYFKDVYGPDLTGQQRITQHWKENSPYYLIDSTLVENLKTINWYFDCGQSDSLYPNVELFHQLLLKYKIPHEYHSRPGKHNWEFWYTTSVNALMYYTNILRKKTDTDIDL